MNLIIDEYVEVAASRQQNNIGMVVIQRNSIIMLEALKPVQIMTVQQRKKLVLFTPR